MFGYLRSSLRIAGILFFSLILAVILPFTTPHSRMWTSIYSKFFRIVAFWCGIKIHTSGALPDFKKNNRFLVVSNHVSYLDIIVIGSISPCVFLSKSEVRNWPVFGWVARALGCVFVQRDSLMGRANALRSCLKKLDQSNIAIFPEGTTTILNIPLVQNWSKGHAWIARRAEMSAVLCLGLVFEDQKACAWTDDQALLPHLFSLLRKKEIRVNVKSNWHRVKQEQSPTQIAHETWQTTCRLVHYACSQ